MAESEGLQAVSRFTLAIDELIVEGYFSDQAAMFVKLKAKGFNEEEVLSRIRQLGLSAVLQKQCAVGDHELALRMCLRCSERFLSAGFQNRLCNRCRARD